MWKGSSSLLSGQSSLLGQPVKKYMTANSLRIGTFNSVAMPDSRRSLFLLRYSYTKWLIDILSVDRKTLHMYMQSGVYSGQASNPWTPYRKILAADGYTQLAPARIGQLEANELSEATAA